MKKILLVVMIVFMLVLATGCDTDATVASQNLSLAADQFELNRRVIFYNGIAGEYMLVVEGLCSIKADTIDGQLELTCKIAPGTYKKHFLGLSDNVTYFVEQLEPSTVSPYYYRVIFKPSVIVPDIDVALP
jgi:uncharacterized membrane protein YciS (DUF1049 family)